MTQASEQIIYQALMEFREEQATFNSKLASDFGHLKTAVDKTSKVVEEHESIKDRAVGAMWFSGILGGTGILAWLYSLVKN